MKFNHCLSLEVFANKTKLVDDVNSIPCDPDDPDADLKCFLHCRIEGYKAGFCGKVREHFICICDK